MWKHMIRFVGIAALLACTGANAGPVFVVNLDPLEEIISPPGSTPVGAGGVLKPFLTSTGGARPLSFGSAIFVLNDAQTELSMHATIFNIDVNGTQTPGDTNDNLVAAHIHSGAISGTDTRGVVARAVTWGFFGTPDSDIAPKDLVITPFASGAGGVFTSVWNAPEGNPINVRTLATELPRIFSGDAYLNFHTLQFAQGEIRGTLQVPEPGSLALLGIAALGLIGVGLRARRG